MLTVYARKALTGDKRRYGVAVYRDAAATDLFVRFDWHRSDRPNKRRRWLMLNCYRWRLVWLPD
jgi:hypothetical protein